MAAMLEERKRKGLFSRRKESGKENNSLKMDISGVRRIPLRRLQGAVQDHADILDQGPCEILEDRDEIEQLIVMSVREPATDGNRMLGVEDVGCRGIIDDDCVFQVSTDL